MLVDFLPFAVLCFLGLIAFAVLGYYFGKFAAFNFPSAFLPAGTEVFYRAVFASRGSVFFKLVGGVISCSVVPSALGRKRFALQTSVGAFKKTV